MISVVIPTYEMHGLGVQFLERALESIESQTYKDVEIVISDNSEDDAIKNLCTDFFVNYFRNPTKGMANNTNYAIDHATGDLIKILYQDDWLADPYILEAVNSLEANKKWLIMGTDTNPKPYWTDDVFAGNNKLGSPSALTIRKDVTLRFNPRLKWVLDCDFYTRMNEKYGKPAIWDGVYINMGIGEHQETFNLTNEEKAQEQLFLTQRYDPTS